MPNLLSVKSILRSNTRSLLLTVAMVLPWMKSESGGDIMKRSKPYHFFWTFFLCLLVVGGTGAMGSIADGRRIDLLRVAENSRGIGPAVDPSFVAVPFDIEGQPEAVFVAWRDPQARIHAGLLRLDEGSFNAFPTQPTSYVTNLSVGVGGPPAKRRAYVAWVGREMELMLVVFDADGSIISAPRPVTNAVAISPMKIAGTDSGALIAYIWDDNPYWDPRILSVDTEGVVLGEHIAEDVDPPQQTLGVTLSATPDGGFSVVYVVSGQGGVARIRRYDETGPVDVIPVEILQGTGDFNPHSLLFSPSERAPFLLFALPYRSPNLSHDLRFAHTTLGLDDVILGPTLSELTPGFSGGASSVAALAGTPELAVVLWQEIELGDNCDCSVPPPIRVEFLAQLVQAGNPPEAVGDPFTVYLWQEGDEQGPPLTLPTVAASRQTPGRFTVLWSDSLLRYTTLNALSLVAVDPAPPTRPRVTMSNFPNPFTAGTTIHFTVARQSHVRLQVFDVLGRLVATLVDGPRASGRYTVVWEVAAAPSGVYVYRLQTGLHAEVKKMILIR